MSIDEVELPDIDAFWLDGLLVKDHALVEALRVLLSETKPPRWRILRRMSLKRRRKWVLTCAYFGWPSWYHEAIKCGVDRAQLDAIAALTGHHIPIVNHDRYRYP